MMPCAWTASDAEAGEHFTIITDGNSLFGGDVYVFRERAGPRALCGACIFDWDGPRGKGVEPNDQPVVTDPRSPSVSADQFASAITWSRHTGAHCR
jgi:hypothetical protein